MIRWRLYSIVVLFVALCVGFISISCRAVQTESFTIVTFNAQWLFDGANDRHAPWKSAEAATVHLKRVFEVLDALHADYISLEEVEDTAMLDRLASLFKNTLYSQIFVQGKDTCTGQDVCALSKIPLEAYGRTEERSDYPIPQSTLTCKAGDTGVSKNYWGKIEIGGIPVTIIGAHFLAYPDWCARAVQREAQAAVIAHLAREALQQGREVIILGDMNDFDGTVPDASSDRPISIVLKTLKDVDPALPGDELHNVCERIPQTERYTYWYDRNENEIDELGNEHSQIDFILLSKGLYDRVTDVRIDHSSPAGWASDHWPIVVSFVFQEDSAITTP